MTHVPHSEACAYALVALPKMTPGRLDAVLARWPDPAEAAGAVRAGRASEVLAERPGDARSLARSWARSLDLDGAAAALAHHRARVLTRATGTFPIDPSTPHAPAALVVAGSLEGLEGPRVAIVGTRAATPGGLADAGALAGVLAAEGVAVVSGMAIGIDGAAHRGTLDAGGYTVGVLATGLDTVYPRRHEVLFRRVRRHGLLVTEAPFGTPPHASRFPVRNRIIAALADAVVVVEAARKGGARITAEWALTLGRPVLAVPGSRRNPVAEGCNHLIADGAIPLLDPADVFTALDLVTPSERGWKRPAPPPQLTPEARAAVRALGGEPATADQIAARAPLTPAQVAAAVVQLERAGLVTRSRGMVWPT